VIARAAAAAFALVLLCAAPNAALAGVAASCDTVPPLNSLEMTQPLNLGELKQQIQHYACSGAYDSELAKVISETQAYVEKRAGEVAKPALVLDIDETALSNYSAINADNFTFGPNSQAEATKEIGVAIPSTLALYKDAIARGVAVFFITGRGEATRDHTEHNLKTQGFDKFSAVVLKPAGTTLSTVAYKSGARADIEKQGYEIVANVGDQYSDLAGGHADAAYKLANPFYFLP